LNFDSNLYWPGRFWGFAGDSSSRTANGQHPINPNLFILKFFLGYFNGSYQTVTVTKETGYLKKKYINFSPFVFPSEN